MVDMLTYKSRPCKRLQALRPITGRSEQHFYFDAALTGQG